MGLADTVKGLLGGKSQSAPAKVGHASYLTVTEGDAAFNTAANVLTFVPGVGVWARIWEFTVPAQCFYAWGFGVPQLPDNQGYMWFVILDKNTDFQIGKVRLGQENHSRWNYIPVCEINDTQLHGATPTSVAVASLIDKKQMPALPEHTELPAVGQDSRLTIDYYTIVPATSADDMGFSIPVTVY